MTRQEFKKLVHRNQWFEHLFGYFLFLTPLAFALWFVGYAIVDYFRNPDDLVIVYFALIVASPFVIFSWWGVRRIRRKSKVILIRFDESQISVHALVKLIAEKINCNIRKLDSGLIRLDSTGWQISYEVSIGGTANELYADLRLDENGGFISWGIKKLKKRFITGVEEIAKENQLTLTVEMEAK